MPNSKPNQPQDTTRVIKKQEEPNQSKETAKPEEGEVLSLLNEEERKQCNNAKTLDAMIGALTKGKDHLISTENQKLIDTTIKTITEIRDNVKKVKDGLKTDFNNTLSPNNDPFKSLKNIEDKEIVTNIVKLLLGDDDIKTFMALSCDRDKATAEERVKWLKGLQKNTKSKPFARNIDDFLKGVEELNNNPDNAEALKETLRERNALIEQRLDGKINLDSVLKDDPGFAKGLAEEIEKYVLDETFSADNEEIIDPEDVEEYSYDAIIRFYNKFLKDEKYKKSVVLEKDSAEELISELDDCVKESTLLNKCPQLQAFRDKLKIKKDEADSVVQEITENPIPANPVPGFTFPLAAAEAPKKDDDTVSTKDGIKAYATLTLWKVLWSVGSFLLTGGVTSAIFFSQELVKGGKNAKLDVKWSDLKWIFDTQDGGKK